MSSTASTSAGLTVLVLGLGLGPACQQLPELRYETEHLRIGTEFDEPLCRGDLDHLELVITTLEAQLATTVDEPIEVYLWDPRERSGANPGWCSDESVLGCFKDGAVYASQISVDHELVHAVVATLGDPAPFWSEGAAEALQTDRTLFGSVAPTASIDLDASQLSYLTAGHFSRWLLETHGLELYRELLRASGSASVAFEHTYEMTLEDAEEQFYAEAPYSFGAVISCDHGALEQTQAQSWSQSMEIDCDNADVHSGLSGVGAFRVLTISERGNYAFSTTGETGLISRCADEDLDLPPPLSKQDFGDIPPITEEFVYRYVRGLGGAGEVTVLDLVPGRYEVAAGFLDHGEQLDQEPRTVQIDVQAVSGSTP